MSTSSIPWRWTSSNTWPGRAPNAILCGNANAPRKSGFALHWARGGPGIAAGPTPGMLLVLIRTAIGLVGGHAAHQLDEFAAVPLWLRAIHSR